MILCKKIYSIFTFMQKNTKILVISGSILALLGVGFLVLRRREQMPNQAENKDISTSELQRLYNQLLRGGASGRGEQEQMKKEQQQIMQQQQERQEQIAKQIQADRQKQIESDKQAAKLKKQQEEFFKPKEQQPKTGTPNESGYNAAYQGGYQGSYESGYQGSYQGSGYQQSGYGQSGSFGYGYSGGGGWWGDRGYGGDISDLMNAYG